jgi:hypothetical protein
MHSENRKKNDWPWITFLLVLLIAFLMLACGCTTVYTEDGCNKVSWFNVEPQQWVLNNTPYDLKVTQNGVTLIKALQPGEQVAVPLKMFNNRAEVVALAYDGEAFVGSTTWIFGIGPQVWQVNAVNRVQPSF